jgi:hypothetical protein
MIFPAAPRTPAPTPTPRAQARSSAAPDAGAGSPSPSGAPSPSPSGSPVPTPSAFAQANAFVYGSPPPSTFAGANDAPVIFYAMLQPTILTQSTNVRVSVITTTNVQRLTIGTSSARIGLSPLGQGKWQGVFSASALNLPPSANTVQLTLSAARNDGQSATIQIPVARGTPEPVL